MLPPQEKTPQPEPPKLEATPTAEERRAENQRKAELLRAQLIAKRQNTPLKTAAPRAETPVVKAATPKPPEKTSAPTEGAQQKESDVFTFGSDGKVQGDALGLDTLIAEGRRAAEAKAHDQPPALTNGHPAPAPPNHVQGTRVPPQQETATRKDTPRTDNDSRSKAAENARPQQLTDAYYADLPAWLDITGYHDIEYRNSKLRTYKERRALEEEKARIQAKLDQLNREEEAERAALRSATAHPASANLPTAPPLPATMPSADHATLSAVADRLINGTKRPHSPTPIEKNARRRDSPSTNGFRIRGANDSPTSPRALERRISYPDARRRSFEDSRSRDPSLERRQAYYKREGAERGPPPPPRYDQYTPSGSGRGGGYAGARPPMRGGHAREYGSSYRGGDAGRGGKPGGPGRRDLIY